MQTRYTLEHCNTSLSYVSKAMSKLEPDIENRSSVHASGIYKGKHSKQLYFFFQNGILDPPTFPDTKQANQDEWDMINLVDQRKLEANISRITTTESRVRIIKKA